MKIKFIKDFKYPEVDISAGEVRNSEGYYLKDEVEEWFQWLIDNGFAEEVKESGWWKPKFDEEYYFLDNTGGVEVYPWQNDEIDEYRYSVGECFKTEKAAEAWRGYRIARATVSQDEGVLTPDELIRFCNSYAEIYYVCSRWGKLGCWRYSLDGADPITGTIAFSTREECQASLDKHPSEWKIIANYDWSRE